MTDTVEINPEEVTVTIWPTVWIYSVSITICIFVYTVVLYASGLAGSGFSQALIPNIIFIILLFWGMRNYRRRNSGYMTYGTAALLGVMVSIISSVLRSTLNAIYLAYVDNSILPALKEETLQTIQGKPSINQQQMEIVNKIYNVVFTPGGMFVVGCISGIILGVIISLILAAVLKNTPPVSV